MRTKYIFLLIALIFSCNNRNGVSEEVKQKTEIKREKEIYKNSLGTGLVIAPDSFQIYNDSNLQELILSTNMYNGKIPKSIYPIIFKPDYGLMHFVCLGFNDKFYRVLINDTLIGYFPRTSEYEFENWNKYIIESYGIALKERTDIYSSDNESSSKIKYNKEMLLCPIFLKGEFIKVRIGCKEGSFDESMEDEMCPQILKQCNKKGIEGWVRWKENEVLKIDILKAL